MTVPPSAAPLSPEQARRAAGHLAADQEGVLSRRQLAGAGVPRWLIRLEIQVGRWQRTGRQTVAVHNGSLAPPSRRWIAVLEVGCRAALDGVAALQQAGVEGLHDTRIDVIVPRGSTPAHPPGVRVRESRRFREEDVIGAGLRRVRPAVAVVHAALWARSDREATYLLVLVLQQRRARLSDIAAAVETVRRHRRRLLLRRVVRELAGGVHALGELDLARDMRRRGLPEPDRQVLRRRSSGVQYLDAELSAYGVVLEIDGAGHVAPWQQLADLVRDISLAAEGSRTVRIPVAGYVLDRERVLDALEELLTSRGWQRAAA